MNINEFLKDSSLHDSQIIDASYTFRDKKVILVVEQGPSEISLTKNCIDDDNLVIKFNIEFHGIEYVSYDIKQLIGYEIYGIMVGKIEDNDIIMLQLLGDDYDEYLELYIRGTDIEVNLNIAE